ncbi:MAG: flagellin [Cellulosilyticaceae bacterium]
MRINHNIPALNTLNQLEKVNNKTAKAMERLSSGLRINSAADDAAGLAIANKMDAQVKGLRQANRNAMDGISLVQTAEGALNEVHAMLGRMRELSVQAANGTSSDEDREKIQEEINALIEEIDGISERTQFNEMSLFSGPGDTNITLQIGANANQNMTIGIAQMDTTELGINTLSVGTQVDADTAITTVDNAIEAISRQRSLLGASQNRLEHTVNNLSVSEENLTSSMSRIQDADMAQEMATFTQQNVLAQAANSMLAQANQIPQQVLQLLQR